MDLVRLIYASRMTEQCGVTEIKEILDVSRKNNLEQGFTGLLCYDPSFFLQCIEGPKEALNKLYSKIVQDERHTDIMLLNYAEIKTPTFGNWSMGFIRTSDLDKSTLEEYLGIKKFDPYRLDGDRAMNFLVTILAQERERLNTARPG